MSNAGRSNTLDNLAHIANMSHELQMLNQQIKDETNYGGNSNPNISNANEGGMIMLKSGKPKRIACVECRQQKSRCDAHEKQPAPCSRCAKKGLKCDLKSDYKRTYKRARIAQIEKEFSELKKTLTTAQASELLNKVPSLSGVGFGDASVPQSLLSNVLQGTVPSQYMENRMFSPQGATKQADFGQKPEGSQLGMQNYSVSNSPFPYDQKQAPYITETNNLVSDKPSITRQIDDISDVKTVPEKSTVPNYALECTEKVLDSIVLSPDLIKSLFLEYLECYHPILPVVDVVKGPERIYRSCPALFWVMMLISLRRYNNDNQKQLLTTLSPLIKDILSEISISSITRYNPTEEDEPILNACSVYSVQAFLLYTFWPPITSSLSADSSWNTIGVALFQAIRIGLHSPSSALMDEKKDPQQLAMAQEQAKTWVICNIVSQMIATSFGFPAFASFDSSLWSTYRSNNRVNIPKSIQCMMEIAHFEDQVAKTLNSNPMDMYGLIDPTERLPLLKVLGRQLDELEIKLTTELPNDDGFRRFQILVARVHLLTYYFMDASRIASFELQRGMIHLYNAAISLINHAEMCQAKDKRFIRYLPGVYILNIWQASCIIAKLAHSPMKKVVDIGSGKQSYQTAISLAAKASILRHDMAHRSSGIMRNMWSLFRTLDEKSMSTLGIKIRTRMAASVFFDCLNLLREQVGMITLNNRNDDSNDIGETEENYGGSYDDEEYGFQDDENVVTSEEEGKEENGQKGSQKSTPSSNNSSKIRRQRSLSSTIDAESRARKIIRTIPLDPQPISANGKRSTIFKVVNNSNESSPHTRSEKDSPDVGNTKASPTVAGSDLSTGSKASQNKQHAYNQQRQEEPLLKQFQRDQNVPIVVGSEPSKARKFHKYKAPTATPKSQILHSQVKASKKDSNPSTTYNLPDMLFNESPNQASLDNIELDTFDMSGDLLWKDVDSVMNDFGFHTQ